MCAVSAVSAYGNGFPIEYWDRQKFGQFQQLYDQAKWFDRLTGQPDCEDPTKAEFMKRVLDRLDAIEKKLSP